MTELEKTILAELEHLNSNAQQQVLTYIRNLKSSRHYGKQHLMQVALNKREHLTQETFEQAENENREAGV